MAEHDMADGDKLNQDSAFRGLKLHNTLTRRKEDFYPLDPDNVRLYVCGPTVYDFAHIGNGRPLLVFDVLFRLLRHLYGADHVTYVRNITDVDDKIIARAAAEYGELPLNEAIRKVTEVTERQYHEDAAALGAMPPTHEPRATENIEEMKTMIDELIAKGHAYVAEDHVLFDVSSMPDYGALSNRRLDEMRAGARVEVEAYKRDPMDFVLWKPSDEGEPAWPSPGGVERPGRPGWHIECSAMSARYLGTTFDIHGGGLDLIFPHHENEIAQSRCAHGSSAMARYWMHNGYLQVEGEKMSKSLGNFITIRDAVSEWPGEAIRLAMLTTHYRAPLDFTHDKLSAAKRTLDRWYGYLGDIEAYSGGANALLDGEGSVGAALQDDLNTPEAIALLHRIGEGVADDHEGEEKARFKAALNLLGLGQLSETEWKSWRPKAMALGEDEIEERIAARAAARAAKNWAKADEIRDELAAKGIQLKDQRDPASGELVTSWEIKR
ncbi:cysteine--tRNA ligase [Afifella sp. JA880]|uniref:cysteine--tRNA ligase n=1 Tax=Afifella sp. JA880 TaxID=2975280 RepID=UPI0021BA96D1|nr:cysteine--tRNA ligase [Afifella sp. JA880]MCT8266566.1 cysteine--tRNA ligase [Afifella sp. JA880]